MKVFGVVRNQCHPLFNANNRVRQKLFDCDSDRCYCLRLWERSLSPLACRRRSTRVRRIIITRRRRRSRPERLRLRLLPCLLPLRRPAPASIPSRITIIRRPQSTTTTNSSSSSNNKLICRHLMEPMVAAAPVVRWWACSLPGCASTTIRRPRVPLLLVIMPRREGTGEIREARNSPRGSIYHAWYIFSSLIGK